MLNTIEKMNVAQPSLRAIAAALDVPNTRLYSTARQPRAGEVYDPRVYNWDAITKFVERRVGGDNELKTFEDVINKALELDAEFAKKDARRGTGKAKEMIQLPDGKAVPARKIDLKVGDVITINGKEGEHEVVYLTDVSAVTKQGDNPVLSVIGNWTFNQKAKLAVTEEEQ